MPSSAVEIQEARAQSVGGKHLYRVEVPLYGNYFQGYEIPEDKLRPA